MTSMYEKATGWVACDGYDTDEAVSLAAGHGPTRATVREAEADTTTALPHVRWLGADGWLYVEPPEDED